MASLRKRPRAPRNGVPQVAYEVLFRLSDKTQTSESFVGVDTPELAKAATDFKKLVERIGGDAAQAVRDTATGGSGSDVPTVAELIAEHIESLSGNEDGTISDYRSYLRLNFETHMIGALPCDVPDEDHVAAWVNWMASAECNRGKGYKGKTIWNRHSLLSAAFERAVKKKYRADNPARGASIPVSEVDETIFLMPAEFALLYAQIPAYWQPLVATLVATGVRWSEATAMRVGDVDIVEVPAVDENGRPVMKTVRATMSIVRAWKWTDGKPPRIGPPKSKKGRRVIGLSPSIVRILVPHLRGRDADEYIFLNKRGNPLHHGTFYSRVWQPAVKRATAKADAAGNPIPHEKRLTKTPRIHDLRHTHASWQIDQGTSLTELQYRLGHEKITTTSDRYGHFQPGWISRSADAVEGMLAEALPHAEPLAEIGPAADAIDGIIDAVIVSENDAA